MLSFNENTQTAQDLAVHYANLVGDQALVDFMSAKIELDSSEMAEKIACGFWEITNLSIEDNDSDKEICGIRDLEFWMYKLFNKVSGYFSRAGYEEIWDRVASEMRSEL